MDSANQVKHEHLHQCTYSFSAFLASLLLDLYKGAQRHLESILSLIRGTSSTKAKLSAV